MDGGTVRRRWNRGKKERRTKGRGKMRREKGGRQGIGTNKQESKK